MSHRLAAYVWAQLDERHDLEHLLLETVVLHEFDGPSAHSATHSQQPNTALLEKLLLTKTIFDNQRIELFGRDVPLSRKEILLQPDTIIKVLECQRRLVPLPNHVDEVGHLLMQCQLSGVRLLHMLTEKNYDKSNCSIWQPNETEILKLLAFAKQLAIDLGTTDGWIGFVNGLIQDTLEELCGERNPSMSKCEHNQHFDLPRTSSGLQIDEHIESEVGKICNCIRKGKCRGHARTFWSIYDVWWFLNAFNIRQVASSVHRKEDQHKQAQRLRLLQKEFQRQSRILHAFATIKDCKHGGDILGVLLAEPYPTCPSLVFCGCLDTSENPQAPEKAEEAKTIFDEISTDRFTTTRSDDCMAGLYLKLDQRNNLIIKSAQAKLLKAHWNDLDEWVPKVYKRTNSSESNKERPEAVYVVSCGASNIHPIWASSLRHVVGHDKDMMKAIDALDSEVSCSTAHCPFCAEKGIEVHLKKAIFIRPMYDLSKQLSGQVAALEPNPFRRADTKHGLITPQGSVSLPAPTPDPLTPKTPPRAPSGEHTLDRQRISLMTSENSSDRLPSIGSPVSVQSSTFEPDDSEQPSRQQGLSPFSKTGSKFSMKYLGSFLKLNKSTDVLPIYERPKAVFSADATRIILWNDRGYIIFATDTGKPSDPVLEGNTLRIASGTQLFARLHKSDLGTFQATVHSFQDPSKPYKPMLELGSARRSADLFEYPCLAFSSSNRKFAFLEYEEKTRKRTTQTEIRLLVSFIGKKACELHYFPLESNGERPTSEQLSFSSNSSTIAFSLRFKLQGCKIWILRAGERRLDFITTVQIPPTFPDAFDRGLTALSLYDTPKGSRTYTTILLDAYNTGSTTKIIECQYTGAERGSGVKAVDVESMPTAKSQGSAVAPGGTKFIVVDDDNKLFLVRSRDSRWQAEQLPSASKGTQTFARIPYEDQDDSCCIAITKDAFFVFGISQQKTKGSLLTGTWNEHKKVEYDVRELELDPILS